MNFSVNWKKQKVITQCWSPLGDSWQNFTDGGLKLVAFIEMI